MGDACNLVRLVIDVFCSTGVSRPLSTLRSSFRPGDSERFSPRCLRVGGGIFLVRALRWSGKDAANCCCSRGGAGVGIYLVRALRWCGIDATAGCCSGGGAGGGIFLVRALRKGAMDPAVGCSGGFVGTAGGRNLVRCLRGGGSDAWGGCSGGCTGTADGRFLVRGLREGGPDAADGCCSGGCANGCGLVCLVVGYFSRGSRSLSPLRSSIRSGDLDRLSRRYLRAGGGAVSEGALRGRVVEKAVSACFVGRAVSSVIFFGRPRVGLGG